MTKDLLVDIAARLSLHEFLLEIHYAYNYALNADPAGALEEFRNDVVNKIRFGSFTNEDSEVEMAGEIQERQIEIAERFFDRTGERMGDILKELG